MHSKYTTVALFLMLHYVCLMFTALEEEKICFVSVT